jgi:hypothetical protein
MVRILIYPIGGGLPVTVDVEGPDSLTDALVLDLRPTDAENVLKGGATEYSFDAPQTPINRRVFDDWQNWQRSAGTATLYRDAILEVDGFPARLGKIALMSATNEVARLTMFFDSEDPFRALQDLRVNELNWSVIPSSSMLGLTTNLPFTLSGANVVTIPAKYRSWPTNAGFKVVTNADFYPCIQVKDIFYQALQKTTPTAPATLDFIAQWCGTDVFERLFIMLNKNRDYDKEYLRRVFAVYAGEKNKTLTFFTTGGYINAAGLFANDSTDGFYDNNNNWSIVLGLGGYARYTAPYSGKYDFVITVKSTANLPTAYPINLKFRFDLNGTPGPTTNSPVMLGGNTYVFSPEYNNVTMAAGDTMDILYEPLYLGFSAFGEPGEFELLSINVEMDPTSYAAGSTSMITGAWIPRDWSVADVFRDVFRMFNLRMFWDSVRQNMAIAPARRWYNQLDGQTYSGFMTQPETDWTDLVVEPPSEVIAERWAWDYWLLHREPADAWLKAQSALSEVRSAGGRINTGRDGAQRNEVELENSAAMAHIFDGTVSNPAYPTVMLPMNLRENHELNPVGQTDFNEDDTCFYVMVSDLQPSADYGEIRTYDIPTTTMAYSTCWIGSQVNYDHSSLRNSVVRPSRSFGDEISVNGNPIPGLISNYHFGTIASANNGKLMKAYIRLSSVALQTYTFDRPVRIGPRIFEVLRINGKPAESDVYEVELRTIDYPDAAALQWLQNPNSPSYLTYDADPE